MVRVHQVGAIARAYHKQLRVPACDPGGGWFALRWRWRWRRCSCCRYGIVGIVIVGDGCVTRDRICVHACVHVCVYARGGAVSQELALHSDADRRFTFSASESLTKASHAYERIQYALSLNGSRPAARERREAVEVDECLSAA